MRLRATFQRLAVLLAAALTTLLLLRSPPTLSPSRRASAQPQRSISATHRLHRGTVELESTRPLEEAAAAPLRPPPSLPPPLPASLRPPPPPSEVLPSPRRESAAQHAAACSVRVHVYNASMLQEPALRRDGFGWPIHGADGPQWLTTSDQHGLGAILLSRLLRDTSCPIVPPVQADLFVVPLTLRMVRSPTIDEMHAVHDFMPPNEQESIKSTCRRISGEDWVRTLHPHLTRRTAYRHIFLHEKFLSIYGFCTGVQPDFGQRVASNPSLRNWAWADNAVYPSSFIRQFSFAYPSAVHLRRDDVSPTRRLPWDNGAFARRYLMMFGGSMHGHASAQRIRRFLRDACANYSEPDCKLLTTEQMPTMLGDVMEAKMQSTFCLEPPGFGDERKAVADALTLGCIPVTFVAQAERSFWPHHWDEEWRAQSHIHLPLEDILSGKLDVRRSLRAIPRSAIAAMQQTISKYAHRIHYAYEEGTGRLGEPDGVELVWRALNESATREGAKAPDEPDTLEAAEEAEIDDAFL